MMNPFSVKYIPLLLHVSRTVEEGRENECEHVYYRQGQSVHQGCDQLFEKAVCTSSMWLPTMSSLNGLFIVQVSRSVGRQELR